MRSNLLVFAVVAAPFLCGCGGGGSGSTSTGAGGSTTSTGNGNPTSTNASGANASGANASATSGSAATSSSGGMMGIPGAGSGNAVDNAFDNTMAANGTPQTALPLGVTTATMGLNVWVDSNMISGGDSNYFVFENGSAAQSFTFDICYSAPITAMNATLWKVASGDAVNPPVGTWTGSAACVTTQSPNMAAMLDANTEYLFGVTVTSGSGQGSYSA